MTFLAFKLYDVVCTMLINVRMSKIVDILTFKNMMNYMLVRMSKTVGILTFISMMNPMLS